MGIFTGGAGNFGRWLAELFSPRKGDMISVTQDAESWTLELERVAIMTATGYLSAAVAQSVIRTFLDGEEVYGGEYYLWNISPNVNQNGTQFLQDLVDTLVYNNEALVVERKGQLFIADSYGRTEDGTKPDIFTGISIRGEPCPDRAAKNVLYLKLHNEDIRPLLSRLCRQYEGVIGGALESYRKAYADKGILNIEAVQTNKLADDKLREDLLNNRFKNFFSAKNAVLPLYAGYNYTPHTRPVRNTSELADVKNMSDEIYNRVGQAFRIPPSMLRGEVANNEAADARFLQLGVRPICNMLTEEITRKRYGEDGYVKGSYVLVDPSNVELGGVFSAAPKIDKLINCGVFSIDEVRAKTREPLLRTPEAQTHYITKNYQEIGRAREGGDDEE